MRKISSFLGLLVNGCALGLDVERAIFHAGDVLSFIFSGCAGLNGACMLAMLVWFTIDALSPSYTVEIATKSQRDYHDWPTPSPSNNDIIEL